jgi:sulfoxide reductase heme-binding subunit YedZ
MTTLKKNWLRLITHIGALIPLVWLLWDGWFNQLTVNPIQDITFRTGKAALILLTLSLACTPVNTLFGWREVIPLRKPLGLYAFVYANLHFLIFVGLDYGFDWTLLQEAIFEKKYALVGLAAFLILLPLAITSTKGWMKRLRHNWKRLHRLVYLAGILVVIHYVWLVKADTREPLIYGGIIALLLIARIPPVRHLLAQFRHLFIKKRLTPATIKDAQSYLLTRPKDRT